MLEEAQVGELHLVQKQVEELGKVFTEQYKELSDRLVETAQDLHTREGIYR